MEDDFRTNGWCVIKSCIKNPQEIADSIMEETVACIFGKDNEEIKAMVDDGLDPLLLLTDKKLRDQYLSDPNSIWYSGNTRTPKLAKSTGMSNIYYNFMARENVLFNLKVYNSICKLYRSMTKRNETCVFLYGPDRVGVKPPGGTDMKKHIDCDILSLENPQDTKMDLNIHSPPTQPLLMPRIQAVACLQCDTTLLKNGNTEVLSGYNQYFELGALFFKDKIKDSKNFNGRKFEPIQMEDIFRVHLKNFMKFVKTFYEEDTKVEYDISLFGDYQNILPEDSLIKIYERLPDNYVTLEWIVPLVKPGDVFCFDQRVPHRNTKNSSKKGITRVVSYISLYPYSYKKPEDDIRSLFHNVSVERNTYDNKEERKTFKEEWEERVNFEETFITNNVMGLTPIIPKIVLGKKQKTKNIKLY